MQFTVRSVEISGGFSKTCKVDLDISIQDMIEAVGDVDEFLEEIGVETCKKYFNLKDNDE